MGSQCSISLTSGRGIRSRRPITSNTHAALAKSFTFESKKCADNPEDALHLLAGLAQLSDENAYIVSTRIPIPARFQRRVERPQLPRDVPQRVVVPGALPSGRCRP